MSSAPKAKRSATVGGGTATAPPAKRATVTLSTLAEKKALGEPIAMVTAYDYPSAQVAEAGGVAVPSARRASSRADRLTELHGACWISRCRRSCPRGMSVPG